MDIIITIIIIWFLAFIVCMCFKEARDEFYEFKKEYLTPDWKEEYSSLRNNHNRPASVTLMILQLLAFPIVYFIFLLLFPVVCIHSVISDFWSDVVFYRRNGMSYKHWLQTQKEKEDIYQSKVKLFRRFSYSGKVTYDFETNTFLYVEKVFNKELNDIIRANLDKIKNVFNNHGFRFIYLPMWKPDTSLNGRANLTLTQQETLNAFLASISTEKYIRILCGKLQFDVSKITSGFFHFACYMYDESNEYKVVRESRFTLYPILNVTNDNIIDFCKDYCELIKESRKRADQGAYSTIKPNILLTASERSEKSGHDQRELADFSFPNDLKDIADNIKKEIEILKGAGYYELLLQTLGTDTLNEINNTTYVPVLSRILITDDFKIQLLDFNKEVRMTPLQKALYIFYLRHPEGVEFKMLSVYYDELLSIYKVLSNREDLQKQQHSIRRLVDATDNAINEKCTRIKEAFLKILDNYTAKNYYIVMKENYCKGKNDHFYIERLKKIVLPRDMIIYPQEILDIPIMNPIKEKEVIENELFSIRKSFNILRGKFSDKHYSKSKLINELTDFINVNPTHYASYHLRAILYTHVGKYNEAIADNQILIDHNERIWVEAILNKAEALYFLGQYDVALQTIKHYIDAIGIENVEIDCYRIRAEIYKKLKMNSEYKNDLKIINTLKKRKRS